jgi:hypothetical protein
LRASFALPTTALALLHAASALAADDPRPAPHLTAVRVAAPPRIDGRLDDDAWRAAPGTDAFTQQVPFDGAPPSEHTILRVLYDDTAIYFGFECEQLHTPIVERLTRRDRDSESDWVWVYVDSRNDQKSAFVFAVNVSGVLADGQIIDQTTFSFEWDENWEAKTARTPTGWSAELRIPLGALRFDGSLPVQSWGLQATRFIAQRQETDLWAYFPRDVASPVAFLGRLEDLRGLKGAGALELLPFVLGDVSRSDAGPGMLGSGAHAGGSAGLDLKWHVAHDLTLDAAFNPDFAQVEADQVILNLTNFETFLPEKRPFFLEGIDAFSFPLSVFYSRRIGAAPLAPTLGTNNMGQETEQLVDVPSPATIYGAGKLVGRLGTNWTVGALSALTAANTVTVTDATGTARVPRLAAPATAWNVLRIKRELGGAGHIGIIGTGSTAFEDTGSYAPVPTDPTLQMCASGLAPLGTRCFHDAYVGGIDGRWRSPSAEYVATGAFIQSYIHGGPPTEQADGTIIGPGSTAPGGWLRVAKEGGKHLLWSAEYTGAGRQLQYNDVGYMARQNQQVFKASVGWRTLEAGAFTLDTASALEASDNRNLSGLDLGQLYSLNTRLRLKNFSTVFLAADLAPSRFDDREVGNGTALERARYVGGRLELGSDPRRLVVGTLADQTQLMDGGVWATNVQASLVVHALRQLDIELIPSVTWSVGEYRFVQQVTSPTDYYFGKLTAKSVSATLRATYTFLPQLTLQAYTQAFLASGHYDDNRAIPSNPPVGTVTLAMLAAAAPAVIAPDFEDAALNVNVVFRWEYRLGSTIYFVYTHSQIPTVPTSDFMAPATLNPSAFRHGESSDVVLLKISYWWAS